MATTEGDIMTMISSCENKSGVRWNRVMPGFNLLRNARYEAQQHDADTLLIRSLFITGLLYILEALPADLSEDEISAIRVKISTRIESPILHSRPAASTLYIEDGRGITHTDQPSQSSLIHRILASSIIQFCFILQSLLPHIKLLIRNLLQSERMHHITKILFTTSVNAANNLCKSSVSFGSTAMKFREGKIVRALFSLVMWWLAAVVGGIHEGLDEGLLILCGEKQKDKVERLLVAHAKTLDRSKPCLQNGSGRYWNGTLRYPQDRGTKDIDIAIGELAKSPFLDAVINKDNRFHVDPDMEIRYNATQGFQVPIDILELGGDLVDKIIKPEPFRNGFIASIGDLLRLRARTVTERGDQDDIKDFRKLLKMIGGRRIRLPHLEKI